MRLRRSNIDIWAFFLVTPRYSSRQTMPIWLVVLAWCAVGEAIYDLLPLSFPAPTHFNRWPRWFSLLFFSSLFEVRKRRRHKAIVWLRSSPSARTSVRVLHTNSSIEIRSESDRLKPASFLLSLAKSELFLSFSETVEEADDRTDNGWENSLHFWRKIEE